MCCETNTLGVLKLEFPNESHKTAYEKLIKEWWEAEIIPTSPQRLFAWKDFEEFLQDETNCEWWINATLFFLFEDVKNEILWALHLRHSIDSPKLSNYWWHIWYWIAPKYRRNWYATKILELWLIESKKLWIKKVMIWAKIDNIWSNKVIVKNGWVFERIAEHEWNKYNIYWIEL